MLLGYGEHRTSYMLLVITPIVVSIAFFLISDIDNPRHGPIRILPENLIVLAEAIRPH